MGEGSHVELFGIRLDILERYEFGEITETEAGKRLLCTGMPEETVDTALRASRHVIVERNQQREDQGER